MQQAAPFLDGGQHIFAETIAIQRETQMLALHCFRILHDCAFSMWLWLQISLFDPYRPELHYMRGPGPKWRAKHAPSAGFTN